MPDSEASKGVSKIKDLAKGARTRVLHCRKIYARLPLHDLWG